MRSTSRLPDGARPCSARRTHGFAFCVAMFAMLVIAAAQLRRAATTICRDASAASPISAGSCTCPRRIAPTTGRRSASITRLPRVTISGYRADGRAEVDYGGGQFRLAGNTNLNVARLDDRQLTLFVARGRLIVRIRVLDTDDVARIDTPNTQIALTRPGLYRIDVTPDGSSTTVNVREGESLVGLATRRAAGASGPERDGQRDGAPRCRHPQRFRRRRLRHVERQPRSLLRARALDAVRVAADGRLCRARPIRKLGGQPDVRRRLVSGGGRARLGAVPGRLLDQRRRLGSHLGRFRAVGLRAVALRTLGAREGALGLVSGCACRATALGAGARRLVRRRGLGNHGKRRSARLRLGSARLGRRLLALVARLLAELLESLQHAVRRQSGRSGQPASALCLSRLAERDDGGTRRDARRPQTGRRRRACRYRRRSSRRRRCSRRRRASRRRRSPAMRSGRESAARRHPRRRCIRTQGERWS